eukprot:IDg5098t1
MARRSRAHERSARQNRGSVRARAAHESRKGWKKARAGERARARRSADAIVGRVESARVRMQGNIFLALGRAWRPVFGEPLPRGAVPALCDSGACGESGMRAEYVCFRKRHEEGTGKGDIIG